MTGRHAAPPDEAFDQLERDRVGSHRADVELPLGPDEVQVPDAAKAPAMKVATSKAAAKKATPTAKKAGKR